jgi:hypothetical protein
MASKFSIRKNLKSIVQARENEIIKLMKERNSLTEHVVTLDEYIFHNYYPNRSKLERAATKKKIERTENKLEYYTKFVREPQRRMNLFDLSMTYLSMPVFGLLSLISLKTNAPLSPVYLAAIPGFCQLYQRDKKRHDLNKALEQYNK